MISWLRFYFVLKGHSRVPQIVICLYISRKKSTNYTHLLGMLFSPSWLSNSHTLIFGMYTVINRKSWAEAKSSSSHIPVSLQVLLFYTSSSCRHVNTANSNNSYTSNSLQSRQLSSFGKWAQVEETEKLNIRRNAEASAVLLTCGGKGCSLVMLSSGYGTSPMGR